MPNKIIKNREVVDNHWQILDAETSAIPTGPIIVSVDLWNKQKPQLINHKELGVWLNSDEPPELIADSLKLFKVVAIHFPQFTDGRGFSYAKQLREVYQYDGEIRAIGKFMRDQLFYLHACGFNAFSLENDDLVQAMACFDDFSDSYQGGITQPDPLFKRR